MKIVVSCDALVSRDYVVTVIENILSLYEDAQIYTLVHKEGQILGPIEQRAIKSSYLSHVMKCEQAFDRAWWKKAFLIPSAAKKLTIPCHYDVLVNVSSGFSQGISCCEGIYRITYLAENQFKNYSGNSFFEKLFNGYLENWAEKKLLDCDELWLASEKEFEYWGKLHPKTSLVSPFFKASDYPLFGEQIRKSFPGDYLCIDATSADNKLSLKVAKCLHEYGIKFKFVGGDSHLNDIRFSNYASTLLGERCAGEMAPILAGARGFVSFQKQGLSIATLCALSVGTSVWLPKESDSHEYLKGDGVIEAEDFFKNAPEIFEKMAIRDVKLNRAQTMKYHDLKFKGQLQRNMSAIKDQLLSKSQLNSD